MRTCVRMRSPTCLLAAFLGLAFLSGCGQPSMAKVTGRVTCKGQPVPEAMITFNPVPKAAEDREPGKPATGMTDAEGRYELSTFKNYDGVLVGEHKVVVHLDVTNPCRCKHYKQLTFEVKPEGGELNIELDE